MYKILLADDVMLTLATEKAYLEGRNLKVFATSSASEAMEMAGVVQPDLIVLDYEMPGMSGAEACRRIKKNPQTSHIPVLIQSIRDDTDIQRDCESSGAAAFVRKAGGREALLETVAKTLGVPRRRHVRVGCEFTAGITDGGRLFTGAVENVSQGGMFLSSSRRFTPGMALRLSFTLPTSETSIRALGEVVRCEEIDEGTHGMGIQFIEMSASARGILEDFLRRSV